MNTAVMHMIIVWPAAITHQQCIYSYLLELNANIVNGIRIHAKAKDLETFITGIYSGNQYDLNRITEKKEGILCYLSNEGILALFFSRVPKTMRWDDDRNRLVYPEILDIKEKIRNEIHSHLNNISLYETIHMTDDMQEFESDFSCLMRLICSSKCEFYSNDQLVFLQ